MPVINIQNQQYFAEIALNITKFLINIWDMFYFNTKYYTYLIKCVFSTKISS